MGRGAQRRAVLPWLLASLVAAAIGARDGDLLEREEIALDGTLLPERITPEQRVELRGRLEAVAGRARLWRIAYESDGLRVAGFLAAPAGGGSRPCVIYNRGGNDEHGPVGEMRAAFVLGTLAARGYVVVASQYRGAGGGEGRDEFGGADVDDVLHLVPLLEELPEADASRLGMVGWSRGGLMTYLALTRTDRVRAAVVGGAVADSFQLLARRPEMAEVYGRLVPGWGERREEVVAARSPIRWPERLAARTPILLLHGTADWRVHPTQSLRMAAALLALRRPFRLVLLEGGSHGLSEHRAEVDELVGEWLDRYVRDGARWPELEPHGD